MYKIISENDNIVKIMFKGVSFTLEKETGILFELKNTRSSPVDVIIPNKFPSGQQIRYLASNKADDKIIDDEMVKGKFGEITISNGIFVGCCAFEGASVKRVVWNDCPCIPSHCFNGSEVEEVANIADVVNVMGFAFYECRIKEITWPDHCDTIPYSCFSYCKELINFTAPYVKKIENHAFSFSSIEVFDWPDSCTVIPAYCFFLSKIINLNNINNITEINDRAFYGTYLQALDLSGTNNVNLAPSSLMGLPETCNITTPYYLSDMDLIVARANIP